jgi:hypothetical protein
MKTITGRGEKIIIDFLTRLAKKFLDSSCLDLSVFFHKDFPQNNKSSYQQEIALSLKVVGSNEHSSK